MKALRSAARAFAEALFADESGPPPADRLDWLADDFIDFLKQAGPRTQLIMSGGLMVAMWVAPATIGKRPPLSRLNIEERGHALEKAESTPAGLAILGVKAIISLLYYEHPDVMRDIGVDKSCKVDVAAERLTRPTETNS